MNNKKTIYVIGTGPSINNITDREWEYLKDKETISFGGFPFSGIETKYYQVWEAQWFDPLMIRIISDNNFNTTLILDMNKGDDLNLAKELGFEIIPTRKNRALFPNGGWFKDEEKPICSLKNVFTTKFSDGLFRFRGSLTTVINASIILGANEIKLLGIDLNSAYDFYDDVEKWIKPEHRKYYYSINEKKKERFLRKKKTRPDMFNNFNSDTMHTTSIPYIYEGRQLRGIHEFIEFVDKELRREGKGKIYITNKESLLYKENRLKYKSITDD